MTEHFDYLIIGGGPGGYELAAAAAAKGKSVALIEKDRLGGTCLNRGCIPTKTYCHAAEIIHSARHSAAYGIDAAVDFDYSRLVARKDEVVAALREGIGFSLAKVDVRHGEARLVGRSEVEVNGEVLTADRIVIATGSAPAALPIPGAQLAVDSDYLLGMTRLPRSMAIIGGGVIGLEFASVYNALGVEVSVIEYCKEILPQFDKDIAKRLRSILSDRGIAFYLGAEVTSIEEGLAVGFTAKGRPASLIADMAVMAVGRRPVLPEGLDVAGVDVERGRIVVDALTMQTSVPGIYAVGDVNGMCMLAHAASAQGMKVLGEQVRLDVIPSVVFTIPEAAMVGVTEETCKTSGRNYKSVKTLYRANGKAVSMDETRGMVKLIVDADSRRVLGCHAVGPHAGDLVQEAALVMSNDLPVDAINFTVHAHPTLSEVLRSAASALV